MKSWSDRLLAAGTFLLFFGAYLLILKGPAANQRQQLFRIDIVALGVIGLVIKPGSPRTGGTASTGGTSSRARGRRPGRKARSWSTP